MKRRYFVRLAATLAGGVAVIGNPLRLFANWNEKAFKAESFDTAVESFFGTKEHTASDKVLLKAADIAENGALVPVSVESDLPNVDSIAVFVEKNPSPLAAGFSLNPKTMAEVSTRLKMGETSNVYAMVRSDNKVYSTFKEVKVTIGGCGG